MSPKNAASGGRLSGPRPAAVAVVSLLEMLLAMAPIDQSVCPRPPSNAPIVGLHASLVQDQLVFGDAAERGCHQHLAHEFAELLETLNGVVHSDLHIVSIERLQTAVCRVHERLTSKAEAWGPLTEAPLVSYPAVLPRQDEKTQLTRKNHVNKNEN